jgi:hypothetical protein
MLMMLPQRSGFLTLFYPFSSRAFIFLRINRMNRPTHTPMHNPIGPFHRNNVAKGPEIGIYLKKKKKEGNKRAFREDSLRHKETPQL